MKTRELLPILHLPLLPVVVFAAFIYPGILPIRKDTVTLGPALVTVFVKRPHYMEFY